jgi:hypothetical protein
MDQLSSVPENIKIYSANLPDLFISRISDYNKHILCLEVVTKPNPLTSTGLLRNQDDVLMLPEETKIMEEEWLSSQKKYFELHPGYIARSYVAAFKGI